MKTMPSPTPTTQFHLWHLPTSTQLLTTSRLQEALEMVHALMAQGVSLDQLLVQGEEPGRTLASQWVGQQIHVLLTGTGD